MKSKLRMFAMLLPVALLTICPNDLNAEQEVEKEKPWKCKGNCQTWIVFDSDYTHMAEGDKFQIDQSGSKVKFVALSKLKGRWKKDLLTPVMLELTQIGPPAKPDDKTRFCGFIDVAPNQHKDNEKGHGKNHMFKIKLMGENMIQITWSASSPDPEITKVKNCENLDDSHGGRVHAEPN